MAVFDVLLVTKFIPFLGVKTTAACTAPELVLSLRMLRPAGA